MNTEYISKVNSVNFAKRQDIRAKINEQRWFQGFLSKQQRK